MPYNVIGEQRNTGRTHFKKGQEPWNKNTKGVYSEAYREKISKGMLGRPSPRKGVKLSDETKEKIRATLLKRHEGKPRHNNLAYQNNIWRELRKVVYRRDSWTCQECGKKSNGRKSIHAHHIDYDNTNNDLSNLITLCVSCHMKTNHKRLDWIKHYTKKVNKLV